MWKLFITVIRRIALSFLPTFILKPFSCHNKQHYFKIFHNTDGSRDISVGIVNSCNLGDQTNRTSYSGLGKEFLLFIGPTQPYIQCYRLIFLRKKNGRG